MSRAARSLRTDLARVRGLGSAQEGVGHWWAQRITAAALVPLTVWFVASILALAGADHETVEAWIRSPVAAVLLVLLFAVTLRHAQLGVQVVIEDYVHNEGLKIGSLLLSNTLLLLLGLASIFAVLKLALGD
jgi:succinate dehydrogenase / fumarate reductase, membrane anchor subunit